MFLPSDPISWVCSTQSRVFWNNLCTRVRFQEKNGQKNPVRVPCPMTRLGRVRTATGRHESEENEGASSVLIGPLVS